MTIIAIITIFVAVLIPFAFMWWIGVFNLLINDRNMIRQKEANLDARFKDRSERLPELVAMAREFIGHEVAMLDRVLRARQEVLSDSGGDRLRSLAEAEQSIGQVRQKLLAYAESYPEVKSDAVYVGCMDGLNEVNENLTTCREAINASVFAYNNVVQGFPSGIVAKVHGFRKESLFAATPQEREFPDLRK